MKNHTPSLSMLYCYLTQGCNLACKHCWLSPPLETGAPKYPVMQVSDFERAISEAKPLGLQTVKLTGGEPLLHSEIFDIIDIIEREELSLVIETNGTLLTDKLAERISRVNRPCVSISIDSTNPDTHDQIRNIPGAFHKSIEGIKHLVNHGIYPQVIASLLPENKDDIINILDLAEDLKADSFKLNIVQPTERGNHLMKRGELVDIKEILDICAMLYSEHCGKRKLHVSVTIPFAFRPLNKLGEGFTSRCGILSILGVLPTGEYALCGIGSTIKELVFGRIGIDKLENVWNSTPVLVDLRSNLPGNLEGICANCTMKGTCLGSCMAQNYYSTGKLTSPFWFCELADQRGYFPESRKICP